MGVKKECRYRDTANGETKGVSCIGTENLPKKKWVVVQGAKRCF